LFGFYYNQQVGFNLPVRVSAEVTNPTFPTAVSVGAWVEDSARVAQTIPGVSATALYDALLQIEFNGGTGGGFYTPCLTGGYFGSVTGPNRCGQPFGSPGVQNIPFQFGVPQTQRLHLFISAPPMGCCLRFYNSITGFDVMDEAGQKLSNATWSVVEVADVPEPGAFVCVLVALLAGLRYSKRTKHA
jgi:hypothetical protein